MGNKRPGTKGCYFYLTDKTAQMITANMPTADARTRSEFVEKAIEQYCCTLNAETSKDILSYEVTRTIKAAVKTANADSATICSSSAERWDCCPISSVPISSI